jgi:molybdopterin-containing oxidoreductase family membrane subunit
MGLFVPDFVPNTLYEMVEYSTSLVAWKVSAGMWGFGLMILTILLKLAIGNPVAKY